METFVHCRYHKKRQLVPVLSHMNQAHILVPCSSKIQSRKEMKIIVAVIMEAVRWSASRRMHDAISQKDVI